MNKLIIIILVLISNSCNSKIRHPYQAQPPSLLSIDTNKYEWAYDSAGNVLIYSTRHCDTVYIHDTIVVDKISIGRHEGNIYVK